MASFTIHILAAAVSLEWPGDRPGDYDPDLVWGWDGDDYAWAVGGGRYKNRLVVVGHDSNGVGTVYFGDV